MKRPSILWKIKIMFFLCFMLFAAGAALEAAVDPVVVELHYQNGVKFYKRGLYDKAAAEFEKTLALDPAHQESKTFLQKIQRMDEKQKRVEAQKSQNAQIQELYAQGKELYRQRDYNAAQEVFRKILELKPVDDFASYYRERCEIFIARKEAKERDIEQKKQLKEKKIKERQERLRQKELSKERKQTLAAERVRIKQEHKEALEEKKRAARSKKLKEAVVEEKAVGLDTEKEEMVQESVEVFEASVLEAKKGVSDKQAKAAQAAKIKEEKKAAAKQHRDEKIAAAKKCREEKLARKEAALQKKEEARQAKILAAQQRKADAIKAREEKKAAAKQKQIVKKNLSAEHKNEDDRLEEGSVEAKPASVLEEKDQAAEKTQPPQSARDLYLQGAEQLGRQQYAQSVESFSAVIAAEKGDTPIYTNAAARLMEKAKRGLEKASSGREKK